MTTGMVENTWIKLFSEILTLSLEVLSCPPKCFCSFLIKKTRRNTLVCLILDIYHVLFSFPICIHYCVAQSLDLTT